MPTRLIDLSKSTSLPQPHLITTKITEKYKYAALSHSWGGKVALTTTKQTLKNRETGISLDELPATFKDACVLALRLKIHYLWIDSLCIVQDDKQDWERESAIMGEIYENSHITISATAAKDSTRGILHDRASRFRPIVLPHSSENRELNRPMVLRPWLLSWSQSIDGSDSPLSSRGWVLQERLLPPRTVHMGHEQLFWECRTHKEAEGHAYVPCHQSDGTELFLRLGVEWQLNKNFLFGGSPSTHVDYNTGMFMYNITTF